MTNLEGRVVLRSPRVRAAGRRAHRPRGDRRHRRGARTRRAGSRPVDPHDVFDELRRASAGGPADYRGITYEQIRAADGVFWPCPDPAHPGTPRLFVDRFPTASGRARFHAVQDAPPAEVPDERFPLYLTTGRVLAHYQSGTQTRRIAELQELAPEPVAEVHPATAARLGLVEWRRHRARDPARLGARGGAADRHDSRRHGVRPVPLGRRPVHQPPDQPGARSDQPDAGVQGVRRQGAAGGHGAPRCGATAGRGVRARVRLQRRAAARASSKRCSTARAACSRCATRPGPAPAADRAGRRCRR